MYVDMNRFLCIATQTQAVWHVCVCACACACARASVTGVQKPFMFESCYCHYVTFEFSTT